MRNLNNTQNVCRLLDFSEGEKWRQGEVQNKYKLFNTTPRGGEKKLTTGSMIVGSAVVLEGVSIGFCRSLWKNLPKIIQHTALVLRRYSGANPLTFPLSNGFSFVLLGVSV